MSSHFIEKCKDCDTVITQCRCLDDGSKELRYGLCEKCKNKIIQNEKRVSHRQFCSLCHKVYPLDWVVPDNIWEAALHKSMWNSLVCLNCFIPMADEKLISWDLKIQIYPTSLKSHIEKVRQFTIKKTEIEDIFIIDHNVIRLLIEQLPKNHNGRNTWLMNHPKKEFSE